jgi:hypothetical protein
MDAERSVRPGACPHTDSELPKTNSRWPGPRCERRSFDRSCARLLALDGRLPEVAFPFGGSARRLRTEKLRNLRRSRSRSVDCVEGRQRSARPSQTAYDKPNRRIEISATIAEAIADALETAGDLPGEVSSVAQRDIAGAGYVPQSDGSGRS